MAGSSWTTFTPGTRIKSTPVNENFEWSNQHIVPHNGANKTDGVYDLGESTARWRQIYSKNIDVQNTATAGHLMLGGSGASILLFDSDTTLAANSDARVPTQKAVRSFVDVFGGKFKQFLSTQGTGSFSFSSFTTITSISIVPTTNTAQILIVFDVIIEAGNASVTSGIVGARLNGNVINGSQRGWQHLAAASVYNHAHITLHFLLSPGATSTQTVEVGYQANAGSVLATGQPFLAVAEIKA